MSKTGHDLPSMGVCAVPLDLWDLQGKQDWGVSRLFTEKGHQNSEQTPPHSCSLSVLLLMGLSWSGLDVGLDGRTVFGLDL